MKLHRPLFPALLLLPAVPLRADSAIDTGFFQLKAELGAAMPTGAGVGVSQVEGDIDPGTALKYLPQSGAGTFAGVGMWAGKTFTAKGKGGIAGTASFHASDVALHIYGSNTSPPAHPFGWASMAPGITSVDMWLADSWDDDFLAPTATNQGAPAVELSKVQNHSWIADATSAEATYFNDLLRRQDFSVHRDKYLCVTALNNGDFTPVPDLLATAYNPISAGLSNATHSRNGTTSDMDGPGRRKPEIVIPVEATSFAAGYLSSASALLFQKAANLTANASDPRVIKAALLAGATKQEFPAWAKTTSHPIDAVSGAGELNIYNSYHILSGGEQSPNLPAGLPLRAWSFSELPQGGTADFLLEIPAGQYGLELSAFAVWHRQPKDTAPGPSFGLNNPVLADYNLTLYRDPAAGGAATTIDSSASTIYNLEHVRALNLPAGHYRLHLNRTNDGAENIPHACALAWRLSTAPHEPAPVMARTGGGLEFTFPALLAGQPYKFQSSTNLADWADESTFTGGGVIPAVSKMEVISGRQYFRLLPVLP